MTRPSPDEAAATRKERLESLHNQLSEGVDRLTTSDGWRQMLDMSAHLHAYSWRNCVLIAMQRPDATSVAGYRTWQKLGRQVRKGAEAIYVLGPVKYKTEEVDKSTGEATTGISLRGFKPVAVFDIADTDGPELPKAPHLTGEAPAALWDGLTAMLTDLGYTVERAEIPGRAQGDTNPREHHVRIDSRLQPMEALAVLFHEYHHVAMGHVDEIEEYRQHRGPYEVEAESATYVAMTALGFETGDWSVSYVSGWADGSEKALEATAERVIATAHDTLDRLAPGDGLDLSSGIELSTDSTHRENT